MDKPRLKRVGTTANPVVIADRFTGAVAELIELAAARPLPPARTFYPGLRGVIGEGDPAFQHVVTLLQKAAPLIGGAFDLDRFDLLEASFSMVTTSADALSPPQRGPHFDSPDPDYLAIMLYLSGTKGTAFFRQRATGIEQVDEANLPRFVAASRSATASGYIQGSDPHYEEIGHVEGRADRLVIYRGALLHSGLILPDTALGPDPRTGRLTLNIFIQGRR